MTTERAEDAWNPGLESDIPRRLKPLVTVFRPGNGTLSHADAEELAELTGLDPIELARFTPERLILHELLVRVTADLSVADGPNYADLGINLRGMASTLFERHVSPELDAIRAALDADLARAATCIDAELAALLPGAGAATASGGAATGGSGGGGGHASRGETGRPRFSLARTLGSLFRRERDSAKPSPATDQAPELVAMTRWRTELASAPSDEGAPNAGTAHPSPDPDERSGNGRSGNERSADGRSNDERPGTGRAERSPGAEDEALRRACLRALLRTVDAIVSRRGRLFADRELIARVALGLVSNAHGAALVGELVRPLVARGVECEGYRWLPPRAAPVVMNVKGASASGKSTIRPRQRELAAKLDIPWEDFALISPDYWRKQLLDYGSLGEDYRYGAMLTGRELEIVDRKLDAHMAAKAARGEMSHLLIDRFRFDSFTLEQNRSGDSRLLTRFGRRVFMFFMVTPPAETVERAWVRGQKTGRYKAVSDLLYHNVEAFTGMPALFLSWVNDRDREVRFEFLDNDVPEGTLPRTAAFGENGTMTVLDVSLLAAIDRYREVDVEARRAEEVLRGSGGSSGAGEVRTDFVRACAAKVAELRFADRETGAVYARVRDGRLVWWDRAYLESDGVPEASGAVLDALGRDATRDPGPDPSPEAVIDLARERHLTLGRWGPPPSR